MRLGCLTVIISALLVLLISCVKDAPEVKKSDVKAPIVDEAIVEEVEQEEVIPEETKSFNDYSIDLIKKYSSTLEVLSQQEKIVVFLDALSSGDVELVDYLLYGYGHDDIKDIKMTYEILSVEYAGKYDNCNAKALLNITESSSSAFPEGEQVYNITARYVADPCYITITKEGFDISNNVPKEKDEKLSDALLFGDRYLDFCFHVTKENPDYNAIAELIRFELYEKLIVPNGGFTLSELRDYIKARFGGDDESYPELEELFAPFFDEKLEKYAYTFGQCSDMSARRVSKVVKTEKGYNVTHECFSDMSFLQKCKELTLVFEENENSHIMRLERIEENIITDLPMQSYSP